MYKLRALTPAWKPALIFSKKENNCLNNLRRHKREKDTTIFLKRIFNLIKTNFGKIKKKLNCLNCSISCGDTGKGLKERLI
jgi:hypothetical protein